MEFAGIDEIYLSEKKIEKFLKLKSEINPSVIKEDAKEDLKDSVQFGQNPMAIEKEEDEEDPKIEENPKKKESKPDEDKMKIEAEDLKALKNDLSKEPQELSQAPPANANPKIYDREDCISKGSNSCCSIEDNDLEIGFDEKGNDINLGNFEDLNEAPVAAPNEVFRNEMDLNIMTVKISDLKNEINPKVEEFEICIKCKGHLNKFCTILEQNGKTFWKCPFCSNQNEMKIQKEKIPNEDSFEYYTEKVNVPKENLQNLRDVESSLIFCFDKSGSMSQSYEIDRNMAQKLKNFRRQNQERMRQALGEEAGGEFGFNFGGFGLFGGEPTYITRMECVKIAIENNLKKILKDSPKTKVGFVLFGTDLEVRGDCLSNRLMVPSKNLGSEQKIRDMGIENSNLLNHPITESYDKLIKELQECEEGGQTALGPAALFSLSMLKGNGNRIFLCTDGCSNLGVGDISQNPNGAKEFYKKLGEEAKQKGTIINLITIEDQESENNDLKEMDELRGGEIIRVNPKEIVEDFDELLENKFLASEVKVQINLNEILAFRNEEISALSENKSIYLKEFGNAREDLELYLEFKFKKAAELIKFDGLDLKNLKNLIFQTIISYKDLNQNKIVRVITKNMKVTTDKKELEGKANYDIVSINATRKTANLASQGDYRRAMANNISWKGYLGERSLQSQNAHLNSMNFMQQMSGFQNDLHTQSKRVGRREENDRFTHQISLNNRQSQRTYNERTKRFKRRGDV
ncbi:MAG: hypothetical protein MJ252_24795 [archaeon]|nr:hypothetical protein [archaeon]